jgi:hypothetical protein
MMPLAADPLLFSRFYRGGLPPYLAGAQAIESCAHLLCRLSDILWTSSFHISPINLAKGHQHESKIKVSELILWQNASYLIDGFHETRLCGAIDPGPSTSCKPEGYHYQQDYCASLHSFSFLRP